MPRTLDLRSDADCIALSRAKAAEALAQAEAQETAGNHFAAMSLRRTASYYTREADMQEGVPRARTSPDDPGMVSAGLRALQAQNAAWMREVFAGDPTTVRERQDRAAEEFFELMQATGMAPGRLFDLMFYVYARKPGDPQQELGGSLATLAGFATYAGLDMAEAVRAEFERVRRPETIARIRAKRATRHGRGALPGLDPDFVTT